MQTDERAGRRSLRACRFGALDDPTGLAFVRGELAVLELVLGSIDFYDPVGEALQRFLSHACIDASAPDELTLACADGSWCCVSSDDGSTIGSGNNGLAMRSLTDLPEPAGIPLACGFALLLASAVSYGHDGGDHGGGFPEKSSLKEKKVAKIELSS